MSEKRPRNKRPRNRGGKRRISDLAIVKRHNQHISALTEVLQPEAESLAGSVDRIQVVDRIREQATALAQERLEGDVTEVVEATLDEIFGLGALEPLLRDSSIHSLRIVGAELFAEGEQVERGFRDEAHARQVIGRILAAVGMDLGHAGEGVNATMMDGSEVRARVVDSVLSVDIIRP